MGLQGGGNARRRGARERVHRRSSPRLHESIRQLLESQARAADPRDRPGSRTRTRSWSRPRPASRSSRPTTSSSPPAPGRGSPTSRRSTASGCSRPATLPAARDPEHVVIVGSGVTGVEFTHMFDSLGSKVTLLVSRQQVLPIKDPEVAAVLEEAFLERGVSLLKGARAVGHRARRRRRACRLQDGRVIEGSPRGARRRLDPEHRGPRARGRRVSTSTTAATSRVNHNCLSNVRHIYATGDVSGKLPLSSVASMQGRKIAEHLMGMHNRPHRHLDYDKAASAIFTEPEIADVGLAEAEAFASGRKIRVTKVPFSRERQGADQGRPAWLREDPLGPRDGRRPRRLDRRARPRRSSSASSRSR